jgi:hypothetical protein
MESGRKGGKERQRKGGHPIQNFNRDPVFVFGEEKLDDAVTMVGGCEVETCASLLPRTQ